MKNLLYAVAIIASASFGANAQKVQFGIKGGLNITKFGGDIDLSDYKTGLQAGAVAEIKFSDKFSLQPELLFNQQGMMYKVNFYDGGLYTRTKIFEKLNYISLPIMAKIYVFKGLSIQAGPQISLLTGAKRKIEFDTEEGNGSIEASVNAQYEKLDLGMAMGVGYDFPFGLFFQGRYVAGISNISAMPDSSLKNKTFNISAGYKF